MNNYSNDSKFRKPRGGQGSDRRSSDNRGPRRGSDRPRFSSQNSGPTQMHDAVCADCKGNCKVPFMPSSGKPVYCSNCFEKRGNGNGNSDGNSRRPSFSQNKRSFPAPNARPQENYNKQFEIINSKLDKIFKLLAPVEEIKVAEVVAEKMIIEEAAPIKKVAPTEKVVPDKKAATAKMEKKKAKKTTKQTV